MALARWLWVKRNQPTWGRADLTFERVPTRATLPPSRLSVNCTVSERMRLSVERRLDDADAAAGRYEWGAVLRLANDALLIEEANKHAKAFV